MRRRPGNKVRAAPAWLVLALAFAALAGTVFPAPPSACLPGGLSGGHGLPAAVVRVVEAPIHDLVAAAPRRPDGDLLVVVDVTRQRAILYAGGRPLREYPVGIGKARTPTPIGEWKVAYKSRNWGGGFGTRWLGLNVPSGIYGLHGTNKPWSVGGAFSGGCIRMHNRDVEDLYDRVPQGTPVRVVGPLPDVVPRPALRPGNTGRDVVNVQFLLRWAGFDPGPADGRFGPDTEAAVRAFQATYGLVVDGVLGPDEQGLLGLE